MTDSDPDLDFDLDPSFEIPYRPERVYPPGGGVEYEGKTIFRLTPRPELPEPTLGELVQGVLANDRYRYGDWLDVPVPVYLVFDRETTDVFRVVVRYGRVEFHVLPTTEPAGLQAFYRRLRSTGEVAWTVECHVERPGEQPEGSPGT